jgi:hypothetical protein
MRKIGFLPDAEKEMYDAIEYYDHEAEGLGEIIYHIEKILNSDFIYYGREQWLL